MNKAATAPARRSRGFLRAVVDSQVWLSRRFDKMLPAKFQVDGNTDFRRTFAPRHLWQGAMIFDVGSGRHPFLSLDAKRQLQATVVGLDIDAAELAAAPAGTYERAIIADVTTYQGVGEADVVICQSLLEHVEGVSKAFSAIAGAMKPGGTALLFAPSRNAVFARLNLLLPQRAKLWLLHTIYPYTKVGHGFVSYYDHCTPADFRALARACGLEVVELRCYYKSGYFMFFFPLHLVWRLWILAFHAARGPQAAETFSMALRKPHASG